MFFPKLFSSGSHIYTFSLASLHESCSCRRNKRRHSGGHSHRWRREHSHHPASGTGRAAGILPRGLRSSRTQGTAEAPRRASKECPASIKEASQSPLLIFFCRSGISSFESCSPVSSGSSDGIWIEACKNERTISNNQEDQGKGRKARWTRLMLRIKDANKLEFSTTFQLSELKLL